MTTQTNDEMRDAVREAYGKVARGADTGACGCAPSCCTPGVETGGQSQLLGYDAGELATLPEGADLGLGCGNPQAIAALSPGEVVVDLGSGAGIDCFLAGRRVGPTGRVIGVDMTPEMVSRARANALRAGADNVEFRLGEIEHLPVADGSVDVILSNCVINLSPDKAAVFREAFRALKPGGRLAIADVVALGPMPERLVADIAALTGCVSGAAPVATLESLLAHAGFKGITVKVKPDSRAFVKDWLPGTGAEAHVASATIEALKPGGADA